jgi:hypothetical protein
MDHKTLLKNITTITGFDITKKSRLRDVVEIKAIYTNILRNQKCIYKEIGDSINMDHSSIIHLKKVYEIIKNKPDVRSIENKLKLLSEGFDFQFLEYQNEIDFLKFELLKLKENKTNEFFQNLFKLANENKFIYDKLVNFYNINSKLKF